MACRISRRIEQGRAYQRDSKSIYSAHHVVMAGEAVMTVVDLSMEDNRPIRSRDTDSIRTPKEVYDLLDSEFHFDDDPCPLGGQGGLSRDWGRSVYMNPPYSNPVPWCQKAVFEMGRGKVVVALLRGDTTTRWFHTYVLPYAIEIRFILGRVRFTGARPNFGNIVVIWDGRVERDCCRIGESITGSGKR